jgi:hypothetical protein
VERREKNESTEELMVYYIKVNPASEERKIEQKGETLCAFM